MRGVGVRLDNGLDLNVGSIYLHFALLLFYGCSLV